MNKVLVAFALKEEFAPWRRRRRFRPVSASGHPVEVTSFGSTEVYVALAGTGAPEAGHLRDLVTQFKPSLAIISGVASGLRPEWRPGDLLVAQSVSGPEGGATVRSDPKLVDLAVRCGAKAARVLISLPRIVRTAAEKARLASVGEAADMESLILMQQWAALGLPCLAMRVILDPVEMPMTCDFEAAMDAHGQVRITRILAQLARQPLLVPDFLRLAKQSRRSLAILARYLDRLLAAVDHQSSVP